jgi:hypothetical protein
MSECKSVTDDGTRCRRQALPGRRYCWQHESRLVKRITLGGLATIVLAFIGLAADLAGLGFPVPTLNTNVPTATLPPVSTSDMIHTLPAESPIPIDSMTGASSAQLVEMTFELDGSDLEGAEVEIQTPTGLTVITIYIPIGTRQVVTLPPGDYEYKVEAKGPKHRLPYVVTSFGFRQLLTSTLPSSNLIYYSHEVETPTPEPCWATEWSGSGKFSVGAGVSTLVRIPIGRYQIPGCTP